MLHSSFVTALLAVLLILSTLPAAAAPLSQEVGPQSQPLPEPRFTVQLTIQSGAEAAALARLLPEWD